MGDSFFSAHDRSLQELLNDGVQLVMSVDIEPFRMPLHTDDRKCAVADRFDDIVGGSLKNAEIFSGYCNILVMRTVYDHTAEEKRLRRKVTDVGAATWAGGRQDGMRAVMLRIGMYVQGVLRQILPEGPAKIYIQQLHPLADPDYRFSGFDKSIQEKKLDVVERCVDV